MMRQSLPGVFAPRWASKIRDWGKDKRGLAVVEFGLIAMPFFLLIFGLLEICVIFIMSSVLEHGASEAARLIRTGQFQNSANVTPAAFKQEVCDNMFGLMSCSAKLSIDVNTFNNFATTSNPSPIDSTGQVVTSNFQFNAGQGSDIVLVRVFYEWDLITPILSRPLANVSNDKRLLQATVAFRNEPF
ncbi:MAG: pilus assembly protein [Henriciella sp.]|nr:pilus assembly protein [Henriciella sp.]